MERKSVRAIIQWHQDPSKHPVNEWISDIVVNFGEIQGKKLMGETWTVLVKNTSFIEGTWNTYALVDFIVDEAPSHLLIPDFNFKL
ncbi:hypothetical protein [Paenibacillus silviterrae]|uniref:hypothetical protein n=1 Tax=Paenibacillus silviterrae TaxID=3242194 RepID=UPI002542AF28|nr:hypothetical protein [Paenibacillus chinjuensis]